MCLDYDTDYLFLCSPISSIFSFNTGNFPRGEFSDLSFFPLFSLYDLDGWNWSGRAQNGVTWFNSNHQFELQRIRISAFGEREREGEATWPLVFKCSQLCFREGFRTQSKLSISSRTSSKSTLKPNLIFWDQQIESHLLISSLPHQAWLDSPLIVLRLVKPQLPTINPQTDHFSSDFLISHLSFTLSLGLCPNRFRKLRSRC